MSDPLEELLPGVSQQSQICLSNMSQNESQSQRSNVHKDKKWKLQNAEMRIMDIYTKKKSGAAQDVLLLKLEFTLKNRAAGDRVKVVGKLFSILLEFQ